MARGVVAVTAIALATVLATAALHGAQTRRGSWQSPVVPLSGRDDVARLICGTEKAHECIDAIAGKSQNAAHIIQSTAKRIASRLATGIRSAPLLATLYPSLPAEVTDFATHAFHALGGSALFAASDMEVLEGVVRLRRDGTSKRFESNDSDDYPYFGFLPMALGVSIPHGTPLSSSSECYSRITVLSYWSNPANTTLAVNVTVENQLSLFCTDTLLIGTVGAGLKILTFSEASTQSFEFHLDGSRMSTDARWYVAERGLRVERFNKGVLGLILDMISTVTLLAGFAENPVPNATMVANFDFMRKYVEASPRMQPYSEPRTQGAVVANSLNESYIQSGDSLIVVRYDGLDPVIGWGEGFSAGHSVVALRDPKNGSLYVCESTTSDAYWPTNGIQCHVYRDWIQLAIKAQHNVLLAPLSPENAAKFNSTAAWEFFYEAEGLNYGFLNFLFGWIDTKSDNFPCLPPTYKDYCMNLDFVETVALLWDNLMGDTPTNVFRQALNHRMGTFNLTVSEIMYIASQRGMSFPDVYTKPELDVWRYNTTRYGEPAQGRSMVCCVFVCHTWKHGGLFDGVGQEINCAEQTLWDIYSMQLFDAKKLGEGRPDVCKTADPSNQLCQLIGSHTFHAKPDFNTRALYSLMGQNCSSLAPDFVRASGC